MKKLAVAIGSPITVILATAILFYTGACKRRSNAPDAPLTFNDTSDKLKVTEIVPTLDSPMPPGKNVIWCASFQATWKAIEQDVAGEPVTVAGAAEFATILNGAPDPRPDIPQNCLYVAAGWNNKGILDQIATDLKRKFPGKAPLTFPDILPDSFVGYCYLEASVPFPVPYFQNPAPLAFVDADGKSNNVCSFGLVGDRYDDDRQQKQFRGLFGPRLPGETNYDFAVDLCISSSPSQVVVARVSREADLSAILAKVEKRIEQANGTRFAVERLLVPEMHWKISHSFSQVKGKQFTNPKMAGQSFDIAQQDIAFRLDKCGAAVISEGMASAASVSGGAVDLVLDRPFLVYMKKREARMPYFAMWVENAELLHNWSSSGLVRY